jgi:hypothetical protein
MKAEEGGNGIGLCPLSAGHGVIGENLYGLLKDSAGKHWVWALAAFAPNQRSFVLFHVKTVLAVVGDSAYIRW